MAEKITRTELAALVDQGEVTLVEALGERYFDKEHLPGAIRVDYDRLDHQASERLPDKEAAIVVYCSNIQCQNSEIAANKLVALGYENVRRYVEGKADWIQAGLPVESGVRAQA